MCCLFGSDLKAEHRLVWGNLPGCVYAFKQEGLQLPYRSDHFLIPVPSRGNGHVV